MFMGLGMPIPDLSNKPGPGRPGWPTGGSYEFKFEVTDNVTFKAIANSAGTFSISYPDGTTTTTSGSSSITSQGGAGIISINKEEGDTTFCDEFAIVGGQTNVSKVISWGNNAWSNMYLAFDGCTSLSDISTTSFISSPNQAIANKSMIKMFNGCTSLLEADIRNWDLTPGVDWNGGSPFNGLVNLQKLDMTGMSIKILTRGTGAFASVGTAVTNGCEFLMSGINWSTSTGTIWQDFFSNAKINPNSDLSNWVFPSSSVSLSRFFRGGSLAGVNSTLNMSGWSTLSTSSFFQFFQNFNSADSPDTDQGMRINISNINVSGADGFNSMFEGCDVTEIIGLSTLGASSATNANLNKFADNARFLKFSSSDNFSNAFIASLNPSNVSEAFQWCGSGVSSNFGAAPNLTNINLSNVTSLSSTFEGARFYDAPDLSTATFPSTGVEFFKTFKTMRTENSNTHVDFSNVSVKISNAREMFNSAYVDNVTFGNNVDFSSCTDVYRKFNNSSLKSGTINITYPTAESGLSWAALTQPYQWFTSTTGPTTGPLTTCQVDNLIRSFRATAYGSALTVDFYQSKITEAPSVVRAQEAELVANGWTITENATDATLPFAYASYAVDPTGITTISPTTTPPAGSVFTATNSLSINSSTGVITINSFRGGTTIRCTYPDGCYNEVQMVIMVPFVLRTIIPANNTEGMEIKPQMSAGECFIDWGDTNSQTVTGNTTHVYASSASDQTYDISIFDSPSGSKFTGFTGVWAGGYAQPDRAANYDKSIMQWGEIEWQNNNWFRLPGNNVNKLRISAPNGAAYKPNLSQVTNLDYMFSTAGSGPNEVFEDVNNNLAGWDTNTILSLNRTFSCIKTQTNRPSDGQPNVLQLSNWDVSNVTNFQEMCHGNQNNSNGRFTNGIGVDVTNWDTSEAVNMSGMFMSYGAHAGIENLNTSKVTNMYQMFLSTSQRYGGYDLKTKIVNGTIRWDVKKVTNFGRIFGGDYVDGSASFTDSTFPTNWYISGEGQDVSMYGMIGNGAYGADKLGSLTNMDAFATKTISAANSPYGTSYTAWDMSKVTSLALFAYTGSTQMSGKNFNISSWQISNKTTTLSSLFQTYKTGTVPYSMDQDIGHWDITNVTSIGTWMENTRTGYGGEVNFSTANYDSLLDITDGWGSQAANVQSGVTLEMGTSQYNPGISIEGTTNGTGTAYVIYDSTKNFTTEGANGNIAIGDILYNKDTNQYGYVTGFSAYTVTTSQAIWGSSGANYRVENSNAARGKIALINAGWFVNDGGAYIPPVTPLQLQFTVASNTQTQIDITGVYGGASTYSFSVNWGDGLTETVTGSNNSTISHTYNDGNNTNVTNPTVSIGSNADLLGFSGMAMNTSSSKTLLIDVPQWGNQTLTRVINMFSGCSNLNSLSATDAPVITAGNFQGMFGSSGTLGNADLTSWDVSSAGYMGYMFSGSQFNGNMSNWNVSNVTNMDYMFSSAAFSGNISSWDVRNVASAGRQFIGATGNPDITGWFYESLSMAYFWAWNASNFNPGPFKIGATATNQNWKYMHNGTSWSTNNWTDFLVLNANAANARNPKTPTSALLSPGTNGKTFDTTRTYNTGFPNGGRAFSFLTADVTVSGGSSAINGVYAYNYTTQKWVRDGDAEKTIEWNAEESVWEVLSAGVSQHVGSGGTQGNGPESSTSWTGGITVVDSSMGWSISNSLIT